MTSKLEKIQRINRKTMKVSAPELGEGETITVRRPSSGERRAMRKAFFPNGELAEGKETDLQTHIVKTFCLDDEGKRLFPEDGHYEDELDLETTDKIVDAFWELTKPDDTSVDAIKKN